MASKKEDPNAGKTPEQLQQEMHDQRAQYKIMAPPVAEKDSRSEKSQGNVVDTGAAAGKIDEEGTDGSQLTDDQLQALQPFIDSGDLITEGERPPRQDYEGGGTTMSDVGQHAAPVSASGAASKA